MPTGYTAKLMEKGQTFPEFVMTCARAFGALITMRDESLDAEIPDKIEPSNYHAECLKKATEALYLLVEMTHDERLKFGEAAKEREIKRCKEWLQKELTENMRLTEMSERVKMWIPPTHDHDELKKFMLQQIDISRHNTDYIQKNLAEIMGKSAMSFYAEAVEAARRDITYSTKEHTKEVSRADSRSEWVKQLRESIK